MNDRSVADLLAPFMWWNEKGEAIQRFWWSIWHLEIFIPSL